MGFIGGLAEDGIGAEADVDAGVDHVAVPVVGVSEVFAGDRAVDDGGAGLLEDVDVFVLEVVAVCQDPSGVLEDGFEPVDGVLARGLEFRVELAHLFEHVGEGTVGVLEELELFGGLGEVGGES